MLTASEHWGPEIEQLCTIILKATIKDADKYQIGLTKIFFRAGMLAYLERLRTERLNYLVTLMQKNLLRAVQQKKYQRIRSTTIALQATWRRILAQRRLHAVKREAAAVTLQSAFRSHVQRSKYLKTRNAAITIQSSQSPSLVFVDLLTIAIVLRGNAARRVLKEQRRQDSAIVLQKHFRGWQAFRLLP